MDEELFSSIISKTKIKKEEYEGEAVKSGDFRRPLMIFLLLSFCSYGLAQSIIHIVGWVSKTPTAQVNSASMVPKDRTYMVVRSVVNDEVVTTGSIPSPGTAKIDPCKSHNR